MRRAAPQFGLNLGTCSLAMVIDSLHFAAMYPPMSTENGSEDTTIEAMPVHADANFRRAFADQTVVFPLGRDIDLAFLALSPVIHGVTAAQGSDRATVETHPALHEVCRMRVSPFTALTLAIQIIQPLVEQGTINKEALLSNIESIQAKTVPNDEEEDSDGQ